MSATDRHTPELREGAGMTPGTDHYYHVRAWIHGYGAFRDVGVIQLAESTATGIVARFASEGLRATVAPVNDDGTVPERAVISVTGELAGEGRG